MKLKRILTGVIGFPIVALILILGNKYIIDMVFMAVAIIAMYEYFKAIKTDGRSNPIEWVGYVACLPIGLMHMIPKQYIIQILMAFVTLEVAILFIIVIFSKMKIGIKDASLTLFGIAYIVMFLAFIPLIYGMEYGKWLVWYIFIAAWGTDTFAYAVGIRYGKHKFSKISPKKSVEGCIGGIIGSIVLMLIYTIFVNKYTGLDISYWYIIPMGIILSMFSQIGDFAASTIKRTVNIKDYSNLFPGHGGMLDRIDSIIFVAPFAYFLLTLI